MLQQIFNNQHFHAVYIMCREQILHIWANFKTISAWQEDEGLPSLSEKIPDKPPTNCTQNGLWPKGKGADKSNLPLLRETDEPDLDFPTLQKTTFRFAF